MSIAYLFQHSGMGQGTEDNERTKRVGRVRKDGGHSCTICRNIAEGGVEGDIPEFFSKKRQGEQDGIGL